MSSTDGRAQGNRSFPSVGGEGTGWSAAAGGLGRAAEVCLALAVLVPPFIFGGRETFGQLALAFLVLAATGLAALRLICEGPRWLPLLRPEVILPLAGLALTMLTWVRLPPGLVGALSPGVSRLLPAWTDEALHGLGPGGWPYLSLAPGMSREGTFLFLLYALLFWTTLSTIRTPDSVRRLFRVFVLTGLGVASVGLLHYLFWNGKFYGLWELWWVPPVRHVRAPFTNRNHFAGFLALTIGPGLALLACMLRQRGSITRPPGALSVTAKRLPLSGVGSNDLKLLLTALGLVLILAGVLLSQSRGGTLVALLALTAAGFGLFRRGFNRASGLVAIGCVVATGLALVFTFGSRDTFLRVSRLLAGDQPLDQLSSGRLKLWKADLHALIDFPLLGSGVGTHRYVCPLYLEQAHRVTVTHAENCYLQMLMECGLAGAALLGLAVFCLGGWSLRGWRTRLDRCREPAAYSIGAGVGLLAALVHGCIDFVWYVPAYAGAVAVLAGLACGLYRRHWTPRMADPSAGHGNSSGLKSLSWGSTLACGWGILAVVVCTHFAARARAEYAWNTYFKLLPSAESQAATARDEESLQQRSRWLVEACRYRPGDPDYFYRLGLIEQQRFLEQARRKQNILSVAELSHTFRTGRFATPDQAKAWLRKLCGSDLALLERSQAHFRRSLHCCPSTPPYPRKRVRIQPGVDKLLNVE